MDLHKFAPGKYVVKLRKLRRKFGAKMVNATFAWLKQADECSHF